LQYTQKKTISFNTGCITSIPDAVLQVISILKSIVFEFVVLFLNQIISI